MNYRYATILAEKTLLTASTETIPINIQDPISRLEIGWHPTLADTMLAALPVGISKIELVDGSDVLHSLNGRENQALCIYDRRVPTMNHSELGQGADLYATFGIDFGRYLYDPELAFDPKQFRNPQLKITHDSTLLSANTSTHLLEVFAHCFDEKVVSPIGFLMSKEHKSYSLGAAAAYEYTDMPTDFPIRQMLVRTHLTQAAPKTIMDTIKLSEDNDKRIPIDCGLEAYIRRMKGEWLPIQESWWEYGSAAATYNKYITATDHMTVVTAQPTTVGEHPYIPAGIYGGYVQTRALEGVMIQYQSIGYLPHHCIQFPFGLQDQIEDWYDVTRVNSLRLRLGCNATKTGAEIGIILQQLRRY